MLFEEKINYDKEHKAELAPKYQALLATCRQLFEQDAALRWETGRVSSVLIPRLHVCDLYHFYYVLNTRLRAELRPSGEYYIYFDCYDDDSCKSFEIYDTVDENTYNNVYKLISDKEFFMPDRGY